MAAWDRETLTAPWEEHKCTACKKRKSELETSLKYCAKCKEAEYCSRECQKGDWKRHKQFCAGGPPTAASLAASQFLDNAVNGFLQNLPENEAFTKLIDCFRMRCEDEYTFGGNTVGIYGDENPIYEFREFLDLAEKKQGLLPTLWNKEKRAECVRWATGGSDWSDISCAVEKSDIQEHYGDNGMPMTLRILGERIYGGAVGIF